MKFFSSYIIVNSINTWVNQYSYLSEHMIAKLHIIITNRTVNRIGIVVDYYIVVRLFKYNKLNNVLRWICRNEHTNVFAILLFYRGTRWTVFQIQSAFIGFCVIRFSGCLTSCRPQDRVTAIKIFIRLCSVLNLYNWYICICSTILSLITWL